MGSTLRITPSRVWVDVGTDGEQSSSGRRDGRGVSRRKFLSGSVLAVGACSQFVTSRTVGAFRDGGAAGGDVQVASLNTAIQDQSGLWEGVRYLISYQVEMADGYDGIDVTVYNRSEGTVAETYSRTAGDGTEDVLEFTTGSDQLTDEFEFTFEVLASGPNVSNPVLTEQVSDSPSGEDPPGDDLGGEDAPTIQEVTVTDESDESGRAQYGVSYVVANADGFDGEVRVRFQNPLYSLFSPDGNQTITNSSVPSGTVSYPDDDSTYLTWGTFDITVEVAKASGIVVDSVTLSDDPGGDGKTWTA